MFLRSQSLFFFFFRGVRSIDKNDVELTWKFCIYLFINFLRGERIDGNDIVIVSFP